jgi:hypothetical protein
MKQDLRGITLTKFATRILKLTRENKKLKREREKLIETIGINNDLYQKEIQKLNTIINSMNMSDDDFNKTMEYL